MSHNRASPGLASQLKRFALYIERSDIIHTIVYKPHLNFQGSDKFISINEVMLLEYVIQSWLYPEVHGVGLGLGFIISTGSLMNSHATQR